MLKRVSIVVASAVILAGCSSRPRTFEPSLAAAPADAAAYEIALATCRQEAAASIGKGAGRLGSAAGGAVAGTGAGLAAGAAAASSASSAMFAGAAAAAAAMVVVAPVAAIAGAWGVSKVKKNKKEKIVKTVMGECLAKSGYSVSGWRVMSKKEVRALKAQTANAPAPGLTAGVASPAKP